MKFTKKFGEKEMVSCSTIPCIVDVTVGSIADIAVIVKLL
jgi:hypothetical protein